jgi:FeS assembly SUF system protein
VGIFSFLTGDKAEKDASTADADGRAGTAVVPDSMDTSALTAPAPAPTGDQPAVGPADPAQIAALQGPIIEAMKTVFDPEIPVDIYELGLIYDIIVDADRKVLVKMTLTSPACPSAQQLPSEVRFKVKALPEVADAWVEIVWEPPWDKDRMSEAAKLQLGIF